MTPLHVLIADDQDLVRAALRTMLGRRDDMRVAGQASDGQEAVAAAVALRPDVILMDVRMPGMTGIEATRRIRTEWPHASPPPPVLVLTTFDLDEYVYAALRAGAAGFILKNSTPGQLAEAIRVAASGQAVLGPTITTRMVRAVTQLPAALMTAAPDPLGLLTERERDVILLIAKGLSNAQIARRLDLTEASVKSTVNRILTRLGLQNRVQAAILVHRQGKQIPG
ncbi:response regulator [Spirillospora sp. CA-255316]